MVRLVLFDIDGTLVRTGGAGVKAFAKTFTTEFNAVDGVERLNFAGRTDNGLVREFFSLYQIEPTPTNFERFFERYVFWLDHILRDSKTEVCPGVWELIHALERLPQAPLLGLLTGNIRLGAEIKLRHFNLWDTFQTGAFGDDHEERDQIAAVAHQRGSRILGTKLRGDEVVVIGDTPLDIRCARAIGARALAVATGGAKLDELKQQQPDWAIADLRAITAREVVA
jgi:phosphoglycolate phosphatase-like HAD superfamily hydrolase